MEGLASDYVGEHQKVLSHHAGIFLVNYVKKEENLMENRFGEC